jgi:hypothetical protein
MRVTAISHRNLHDVRGVCLTVADLMVREPAGGVPPRGGRRRLLMAIRMLGALTVLLLAATTTGVGAAQARAHHHRRHAHHHRRRRARIVSPLQGRAMWIWELSATDGGNLSSIVAQAHAHGVTTLMIKSSDGVYPWSQFNAGLVRELHADHLKVCAWEYVYGDHPGVEANLGADAIHDGADCLIIDAESQYQGRYVAAQAYVRDLREQVGPHAQVALAGFPYIDYHPGFPFSVFLGPHGAQYDVPQMYWRDIGVSPAAVFAHTYAFNLIYHRPIYPLGQLYGGVGSNAILRFRELTIAYHAGGISWWDWQSAPSGAWAALDEPAYPPVGFRPDTEMASLGRGAVGDVVVWAQEHLVAAGYPVTVDGGFGPDTRRAVIAFQRAHRLTADGIIGSATWRALLHRPPAAITWVGHGSGRYSEAAVTGAASASRTPAATGSGGEPLVLPVPKSASLPARRDEIPAVGAGGLSTSALS